jgi:hypothetical protein
MPDLDKLTGYRLPGAANRLSAKLKEDRMRANRRGDKVPEPTGPSIKQLDKYVTDTASGQLARRKEATNKAIEGKMPEYKKGGMVKKTGPAKLHKGERVLTKSQTKQMSKRMSKRG